MIIDSSMIRSQASNRSNSMTGRPGVSDDTHRSNTVRFSLTDIRIKDNEITVDQTNPNEFLVHLGFLQHQVRYKVTVPISKDKMPAKDCNAYSFEASASVDSIISQFNLSHDSGNFYLNFEISAITEKTLSDVVRLKVVNTDVVITYLITASVLGTGKGTPLLKNGIHVVEVPQHVKECTEYPRNKAVDGATSEDSS